MVNKFAVLALFVSGAAFAAGHQSSITDRNVSFDSMDSAAKAAITNIYSISTTVEYAGFIVQLGEKFYLTSPFTSDSDDRINMNVKITIPKGSKIVAYFHNHPNINIRGSVNRGYSVGMNFSSHDINFAKQQNFVAYVAIMKHETILRYDPSNEHTVIVE